MKSFTLLLTITLVSLFSSLTSFAQEGNTHHAEYSLQAKSQTEPNIYLKQKKGFLLLTAEHLQLIDKEWVNSIEVIKNQKGLAPKGINADRGAIIIELKEEYVSQFMVLIGKE